MSKIKEFFQNLVKAGTIPQEPMNHDAATLKIYIDYLEAENAALRERLDKAVELPFVPSDYHIEMWAAQIKESCVDQCATIVIPCYLYIKCEDKNAAVERLNELRQYADN